MPGDGLYKHEWSNDHNPGYVVYRDIFDHDKCTLKEGIAAHMAALFVTEAEAQNYCEYRNHMMERYGTDDVEEILDFDA